ARSRRASTDSELIRRSDGASEFYTQVGANVQRQDDAVNLQINFRSAMSDASASETQPALSIQKYFRVNGAPRRASALIGHLNAVMFSANDLDLVYGSPSVRRRYLNILISQIDNEYLRTVQRYERVVRQRNFLLKQIREGASQVGEIAFWDDQLVAEGSRIMAQRIETVNALSDGAMPIYANLSGGGERMTVKYHPNIELTPESESESAIADALRAQLVERQRQELARGITVTGPHRDDVALALDGLSAAGFASRGQSRTAVLALKLAEGAYLRSKRGQEPVLLLDDVLSELDAVRREQVLGLAAQYHQTLITTADADAIAAQLPSEAARFSVCAGLVQPIE
ncbi:MAG: DNA replication and repair protein RecF, partial [Chloroflexi bacterium]|nr:DNA replication and repair protein RecF [Chloroflexota bacterium]